MGITEILLGVAVLLLIVIAIKQFTTKKETVDLSKDIERGMTQIFPSVLKHANDQLISMARQQLDSEKREIKTDLVNKKEAIEKLVSQVLEELNRSNNKIENTEKERIAMFNLLKKEVENHQKITEQLSATTEGLKKVLSNNQLRGQFGEQVAEDLLKMCGFVRGTNYEFNKEQKGTDSRPDFAIFMPDGTRINVDAKFPYSNLQKMIETEDQEAKKRLMTEFERDIKNKIKQVTTRDYIDPENKTVDFVILFIPNEMIFSFIYDKMNDVWTEAMRNKVVMAGPFSFTAILRLIAQAYSNFRIQENTHKIIQYIKTFEKEFANYSNEFEKIGKKIRELDNQYATVSTTRTNVLLRTVEKIKLEDSNSNKESEPMAILQEPPTLL